MTQKAIKLAGDIGFSLEFRVAGCRVGGPFFVRQGRSYEMRIPKSKDYVTLRWSPSINAESPAIPKKLPIRSCPLNFLSSGPLILARAVRSFHPDFAPPSLIDKSRPR